MSILIKPIITEKATNDSELRNCYVFQVAVGANKIQIKQAVEDRYGAGIVKKVRTINVRPDYKSKYTKSGMITGKTKASKKAFVQLVDGEEIDLFNNL